MSPALAGRFFTTGNTWEAPLECVVGVYLLVFLESSLSLVKKVPQLIFDSVKSLSPVQFFATPWTVARHTSLSITILEFAQTHVHRVGDAIQPSHPLLSPSPPAFNLSRHQGLYQ